MTQKPNNVTEWNGVDKIIYLMSGALGGVMGYHEVWYVGVFWAIVGIGLWELLNYEGKQ